jgi:hypothetical protein
MPSSSNVTTISANTISDSSNILNAIQFNTPSCSSSSSSPMDALYSVTTKSHFFESNNSSLSQETNNFHILNTQNQNQNNSFIPNSVSLIMSHQNDPIILTNNSKASYEDNDSSQYSSRTGSFLNSTTAYSRNPHVHLNSPSVNSLSNGGIFLNSKEYTTVNGLHNTSSIDHGSSQPFYLNYPNSHVTAHNGYLSSNENVYMNGFVQTDYVLNSDHGNVMANSVVQPHVNSVESSSIKMTETESSNSNTSNGRCSSNSSSISNKKAKKQTRPNQDQTWVIYFDFFYMFTVYHPNWKNIWY